MDRESEKRFVVKERLQDIRDTKYTSWFAFSLYIILVIELEKGEHAIFNILVAIPVIILIGKLAAKRQEYRDSIFENRPFGSTHKPLIKWFKEIKGYIYVKERMVFAQAFMMGIIAGYCSFK